VHGKGNLFRSIVLTIRLEAAPSPRFRVQSNLTGLACLIRVVSAQHAIAMKPKLPFFLVLLGATLAGCAHQEQSHRFSSLREQELADCRRVAVEAAGSPELWQKVGGQRLTKEPLKLDTSRIRYDLDCDHQDRIEVIIPSGGTVGWHSCYVEVAVNRTTLQVISIDEYFWP